jgi:hypothetical protein
MLEVRSEHADAPDGRTVYIDSSKWYSKTSIYFIFAEIGVLSSNGKAVDFRGTLLGLLAPDAQIDGKHST